MTIYIYGFISSRAIGLRLAECDSKRSAAVIPWIASTAKRGKKRARARQRRALLLALV
jgi:hypothetical protein